MRKLLAITAVACCLIAILLVLAAWIFGPLALALLFPNAMSTITLVLGSLWAVAWLGVVVLAIVLVK